MNIPQITKAEIPDSVTFRRFARVAELNKIPPTIPTTGEDKDKWIHKPYRPLHRT